MSRCAAEQAIQNKSILATRSHRAALLAGSKEETWLMVYVDPAFANAGEGHLPLTLVIMEPGGGGHKTLSLMSSDVAKYTRWQIDGEDGVYALAGSIEGALLFDFVRSYNTE